MERPYWQCYIMSQSKLTSYILKSKYKCIPIVVHNPVQLDVLSPFSSEKTDWGYSLFSSSSFSSEWEWTTWEWTIRSLFSSENTDWGYSLKH
jgi:hypothetical protein